MKRIIIDKLINWKQSKRRKPLILCGARQVGKTWILQEFGKTQFEDYMYINFDKQVEFHQFFETTKDVKRILQNLAMAVGKNISESTLIIFDEIQACPNALNTLKYFCEDLPNQPIACAGSLLGLMLSNGFPVGKVEFLHMGPMTFEEFLLADGSENLVNYLNGIDTLEPIPDAFANPLTEKLKMYFITGGMPEAVDAWVTDSDISQVDYILSNILEAYELDFAKHAHPTDVQKIQLIWGSLPSQLAKENKKFIYSVVREGARAREYENALMWLVNANIVTKISKISKPGLPLSAYEDLTAFKVYMTDVGILRKKSYLSSSAFNDGNRLFTEFKGALTENFILQNLLNQFEAKPYYWADTKHEVDFVIQYENSIVPIEVKSGNSISSPSIKRYAQSYQDTTPLSIRFSMKNLSYDGNILNVPLYMVNQLDGLIKLALEQKPAISPVK